jgi:hypothetical protein
MKWIAEHRYSFFSTSLLFNESQCKPLNIKEISLVDSILIIRVLVDCGDFEHTVITCIKDPAPANVLHSIMLKSYNIANMKTALTRSMT